MTPSEQIKRLFAEYEKAFSELDIEKNAEFFADTFISAGPKGAIACFVSCAEDWAGTEDYPVHSSPRRAAGYAGT